jgi:hypothetical protein
LRAAFHIELERLIMPRKSKPGTAGAVGKGDPEKKQTRNRLRRAATLLNAAAPRTKAARDETLIKRKIDYVVRAMMDGVPLSKARKEVSLSKKMFEGGIKGKQFFARDKATGARIKNRGKLQINLKPTNYIDSSGDMVTNSPLVGENAALVRDWQKQVHLLLHSDASKADKIQARKRIAEISKQKIVDVYGNRIDLTGDLSVIELARESSDYDELPEFMSQLENTDGRQKK